MLTKPIPTKKTPNPSTSADAVAGGNARLLHDIEALSKALSLDSSASKKPSHRSVSAGRNPNPNPKSKPPSQIDKKKPSFWSWKPLKALSHLGRRRFDCRFRLHVHSIENLPSFFSDSLLAVHWKRTTDPSAAAVSTRPARVFDGAVEFEETLAHHCSVYGTRSGSAGAAKYESRHFLIFVSVVDSPGIDLGRNLIDLTRLLPSSLDELEEEDKSCGRWSTCFRLSGKGKGASLNVSFGFSLAGDGSVDPNEEKKVRRIGSLVRSHDRCRSVDDAKVLHEVLTSLRPEVSLLAKEEGGGEFEKSGSGKVESLNVRSRLEFEILAQDGESPDLKPCKGDGEKEFEGPEFMVIDQGFEIAEKDQNSEQRIENIEEVEAENSSEIGKQDQLNEPKLEKIEVKAELGSAIGNQDQLGDPKLETIEFDNEKVDVGGDVQKEELEESSLLPEDTVLEELDSTFDSLSVLELEKLEQQEIDTKTPNLMSFDEMKLNYKRGSMKSKSLSLDDESVASQFLSMLGIEHSPFGLSSDSDPESPRERLWKQFEKDSLAAGGDLFGLDVDTTEEPNWVDGEFAQEDFDLSSIVHEVETELDIATQAAGSKSRAKMLEDAETEALMRQWGLNEKAFQRSPPGSRSGFGSPIDLPPEEPLELPPLGEGLGPFVQTKDGGFLRSMCPSFFKNAKNNGSLIMQVSSPVVVPAEMGSGIMEILQRLASDGIEKLSMQAKKLMPLEDITGRTMQQIAWEAAPALEACERQELQPMKPEESGGSQNGSSRGKRSRRLNLASSCGGEIDSEYVSLEDLAPLAMDKIEALSIEGLRIQSGMSDEEAPSNISPQSIGNISALEGKGAMNSMSLGLEGTGGLQLVDVKDSGDDVDGLMGLSISLEEWMRLDSGVVGEDEDHISDRTSKILAAHHACSTDLISGGWNGDKRSGKRSGRRWGLLGNHFTVALMVQLRDPLRNYEPVGTPMLSLIQVERVFVPPKPKIYSTVSEKGNSEQDDEPETKTEPEAKEAMKEEENVVPQFKITEVTVAGLKTEHGKKKPWGNPVQQQSGSRWLLASGMGKSNKHPFMKSKAVSKPSPVTTTVQPGETLWSISSRVHGNGAKWKELLALNPHIRNPNVIFPNETIRLQ